MIKMGEITCRIPSNGVKPEILYCTEPEGLRLDVWTTTAAWATAFLTLGLLVAAVLAARAAISTLRQMKKDSIAQSRPYVYAQLVPGLGGVGTWDLIIKNAGQSAARNVTATVSEWPEQKDFIIDALSTMFSTPQTLPPGTHLRTFWYMRAQEGGYLEDPETGDKFNSHGLPDRTKVFLSYEDEDKPARIYRDEYDLSTETIGMTPISTKGPNEPRSMEDPDAKAIYKILGYVVRQLGELRR